MSDFIPDDSVIPPAVPGQQPAVAPSAADNYGALFSAAEQEYGLPDGLLKNIAVVESGNNPAAVSRKGARGLMQFMPETAVRYGVNPDDPASSINGAGRYLRDLTVMFGGDLEKAVAAYNAGEDAVQKHNGVPPYKETRNYVGKVLDTILPPAAAEMAAPPAKKADLVTPEMRQIFQDALAHPDFKAMPSDQQEAARIQLFRDYVAPTVPISKLVEARKSFDAYTAELTGSTTAGDVFKSFVSGALNAVGETFHGAGDLLTKGINAAGEAVGRNPELRAIDPLKSIEDAINESKTPAGKRAEQAFKITGDTLDPSTWKVEGLTPGGALQFAVQTFGQYAPQVLLALVTGGTSTATQAVSGAVVGGLQGYGGGATQERDFVMNASPEELAQKSTFYKSLIDQSVPQSAAREATAKKAEFGGGLGNGIPSALEGAVEQLVLKAKIPVGFGKGVTKAATGAVMGAVVQGAEEDVEQRTQNLGSNVAIGGIRPIGQDTLVNAVGGFVGGAGFGAATSMAPGQRRAPQTTPPGPLTRAANVAAANGIVPPIAPEPSVGVPEMGTNVPKMGVAEKRTPALPAPRVIVTPEGVAGTEAQFEQQRVAQEARRDDLGFTPDVERAGAAHPGKAYIRPPKPFDPRINRADYRAQLQKMAGELVESGGVAYVRDERGTVTGRTPSVNPDWFKGMSESPEHQMTVAQVKNAVQKALDNQPLGVREARVVSLMLNEVKGERTSPGNMEYVRNELERARELRRATKTGLPPSFAYSDDADMYAGQVFEEQAYNPELTGTERAVYELAQDARSLDEAGTDALLEQHERSDDVTIARALWQFIAEKRHAEKPTQETPTAEPRGPEGTPGYRAGVQAEEARAPADLASARPQAVTPSSQPDLFGDILVPTAAVDTDVSIPQKPIAQAAPNAQKNDLSTESGQSENVDKSSAATPRAETGTELAQKAAPAPAPAAPVAESQAPVPSEPGKGEVATAPAGGAPSSVAEAAKPDTTADSIKEAAEALKEAAAAIKDAAASGRQPEAKVAAEPTSKIEDVGEKIGGLKTAEELQPSKTDTVEKYGNYGASNTIFTKDDATEALILLRKKLNQLNAGLDPEIIRAGLTLAGFHIEAGARSFAAYTKAMVEQLGESVTPYLREWYESIRAQHEYEGMTPTAEIDKGAEIPSTELPPGRYVKDQSVTITKRGRKWFEALPDGKRYTVKVEINTASDSFAVDERRTFPAMVDIQSSKYGTSTTIYPLTPEQSRVGGDKAVEPELIRWLGYVEEKATSGYVYKNGVDKLNSLGIDRFPGLKKRLDSALSLASSIRDKESSAKEEARSRESAKPRTYLDIPYDDKEIGKRHGARWDNDARLWYVTGEVPIALQKYNPSESLSEGTFKIGGGQGYGYTEFRPGETVRNPRGDAPKYVTVLTASKKYFREDGMSFGVGDESGYVYMATARPATAEESAPLVSREAMREKQAATTREIDALAKKFREQGERPEDAGRVDGERILDTQNIYGGGDWWVIQPDAIWYIQNNGADGDNWSLNNVRTGGAGAIGWRMPFNKTMVPQLREADRILKTKETDQGTALFSRRARTITGDDTLVSAALSILARNDEMFQLPVSESEDMAGIVLDVYPEIRVIEHGRANARAYNVDAVRAWTLTLPDRNGKDQTASVVEMPGDKLYINVSEFHVGGGGSRIYHIAANYAYNNGLVFVGDPYGLSDDAAYRRTENMLSSALKFGTTQHLAPHERQLEGDRGLGIMPLDWEAGNDAHNINRLAEVSYSSIVRRVPELANIGYNVVSRRFEDADGNEVSDKRFVELATRPGARAARAGRDTLKRTALINTLVQTSGSEGRSRVLGELLRQSGQHLDPALRRIFYSRPEARPQGGLSASRVREILARPLSRLSDTIPIEIVQSVDDLPFDAPSDTRGVYDNGKVWLVADQLTEADARRILTHEVVGHLGLEEMLGPDAFKKLVRDIQLMKRAGNKDIQRAALRVFDTHGKLDAETEAKEILAYLAENGIQISLLRRIVAQIRLWLARMGLGDLETAEIENLIAQAARFVEGKAVEPEAEAAPAFSKVAPKPDSFAAALRAEWDKYDDTGEYTHTDLVDAVEGIAADSEHSLASALSDAVEAYRQEQADDRNLGGRGDMEQAEAAFNAVLRSAMRESVMQGQPMYSRAGPRLIGDNGRAYTDKQREAFRQVGREVEVPTIKERIQSLWTDAGKKLAQGLADQFAPVKDISQEAYRLLRLSKGASGAFRVFLNGGKLKLTDNVYDFDDTQRGGVIEHLLIPLQGESDDFLWWVAANRAEQLTAEDREHLFSRDDIAAVKTLEQGTTGFDYTLQHGTNAGRATRDRTLIYRDALHTFNEFNKNALDMAEQSGLIDGDSRRFWEKEFYVPFYRMDEEEGLRGMNIKSGVVRQQAFKHLKGGRQKLSADLLENTLLNWAHLLDAAAKNRAAKATLEAAERMGAARKAEYGEKHTVWFMDRGRKVEYKVDDPHLLTAISALEYAGMKGPLMSAMGQFKHLLTIGVTASPFFKIRNLIRDSVQSIGVSPLSYNAVSNIARGYALTHPESDNYFRLLAGGGTIHFGTMLEGSESKRVRALVEAGVDESTILDNEGKLHAFYKRIIEPAITAYNEIGNRGEAINRAALYDQLVRQGGSHAEASLLARDLMDFSMQGAWTGIRFLSQTVPFFNARLQGLYKLGRSAKEDPRKLGAVLGATALFSIALMLAYEDDDDWKKREDWDRDNYWWFKIGGTAFRIPKPFEIGAMASLAERGVELFASDEMTGERFRSRLYHLLADNLSFNPVPQLVKPVLDIYANTDSFTRRPIETLGMERLQPDYRMTSRTSMAARGLSTAGNVATGGRFLSPVQVDHLIHGYFGWLGSFVVGTADIVARPATGQVPGARRDYWKVATGGIVADKNSASSRYVTQMYEQSREIEQAYGTWRSLLKEGKAGEAREFREENMDSLKKYGLSQGIKRQESKLNERIRMIERSNLSPEEKRRQIDQLRDQKDRIARRMSAH